MKARYFTLMLSALFLTSCGPSDNKEDATQTEPTNQAPMQKLKPEDQTLTPEQEDMLKIDEDNIMTPIPG